MSSQNLVCGENPLELQLESNEVEPFLVQIFEVISALCFTMPRFH